MSAVNLINENDDEREIASQAACALRESFITAAQSGPFCMLKTILFYLRNSALPQL